MQVVELPLRRVAPQRYIGDSAAVTPGSYFVNVRTLADKGPLRVGVNVPYSSEFRQRESNLSLLQHLAAVQPVRRPARGARRADPSIGPWCPSAR